MSDTSALVGVGLVIMDSSMFVATMTGLPRFLQPCTMRLCQYGTCKHDMLLGSAILALMFRTWPDRD